MFFGPGSGELPLQMKVPIMLGTIGIFVGIPLLPTLSQMILGKQHWITQRFMNSAFKVYWHDKKLIGLSLAQSMGLQVVLVGMHVLIGLSLGLTQVPVWYYCVFYPLVAVLGFVTPSFNGIGVREGAYTYFLMLPIAGVDKTHAFRVRHDPAWNEYVPEPGWRTGVCCRTLQVLGTGKLKSCNMTS